MEERKVNSKRKSLDALLSITKQLDDKEIMKSVIDLLYEKV